jgi:glutamate synthase (NADPH/NADH) large chain
MAGEICRRVGPDGLADNAIDMHLTGTGGQSFGAFAVRGMTLDLVGVTNDYPCKGLSGGRVIVRPDITAGYAPADNVVTGNVALYGATAGEAFFRGRAGERFCVRNSGATAVVEGVGDHGCEYMTGGVVAVLGPTGRNFAAGMTGGIAYVLDRDGGFSSRCNHELVDVEPLSPHDVDILHVLLIRHADLTGSDIALRLLANWPGAVPLFQVVVPHDIRHTRGRSTQDEAAHDEPLVLPTAELQPILD